MKFQMSELIRQVAGFPTGYTPITEIGTRHPEMRMDFGILRLQSGESRDLGAARECALLMLDGEARLEWDGGSGEISRDSLFDQLPWCLHVPSGCDCVVSAGSRGAELAVQATDNTNSFPPRLYAPGDCRVERRGEGTMNETSTRFVRTIFDDRNAPQAELVLGEVIDFPGRWSSYPPHHHPQPEIYHYRFLPEQGFGLTAVGEQAFLLRHCDTVLIHPGEDHPQVAAPGYAMYYIWLIRHLEGERYDTPEFTREHRWVTEPNAKIWPSEA
jgi:5-deoxy-glucuronate isomerase